jgi:3-hydroxy-9,10-secoandrosta-1,3,5(10)-triene-9,17-dione monooxygenase reductase component
MTVDPMLFRRTAGMFATGVLVVTTGRDGSFRAITVNSFTTVSLEPTLLLICMAKNSRTLPVMLDSRSLTVNVLREDQEEVSRIFASSAIEDGLDRVDWEIGLVGTPVIAGCLAYFHCRVEETHEAGDHIIVLARVEEAQLGEDGRPLIFFRGRYGLGE